MNGWSPPKRRAFVREVCHEYAGAWDLVGPELREAMLARSLVRMLTMGNRNFNAEQLRTLWDELRVEAGLR